MTPAVITALAQLGPTAGVLIVVGMFLYYITKREAAETKRAEKRDKSWQDFFTTLNASNCEDTAAMIETQQKMSGILSQIVQMIKEHDERVDDRIAAAAEAGRKQVKTRL